MAGNTATVRAQPSLYSTRSQTARNSSRAATDNQDLIFSSTQAKNFFYTMAARKVVPERQIIWDDLSLVDVIPSDDLAEQYRLHRVNFLLPNFNISMVKEFCYNISSNFPESSMAIYVCGVMVAFDPSIICTVLELDLSSATVSSKYNVATSQYDLSAYHHESYVNPSIPLVKGHVSKSHLKTFYKIWSDFIRRNVLGTSNNSNPTVKSARVLFAMLTPCDVPFGFLIFKSIMSKSKHAGTHQKGSTIHPCLITQLCEHASVKKSPNDLCPRTTKDLDRNVMNLSDVMCVVAQGDPKPVPQPNASQDRKIAYLESTINSLRKQFVDLKSLIRQSVSSPLVSHSVSIPSLSQTSLNPSSFVPEPSLHPPKLVP